MFRSGLPAHDSPPRSPQIAPMPTDSSPRHCPEKSEAYEEFLGLFSRSQSRVQAYIRSLVPDAAHADDVFQATSLVLWRSFDTFDKGKDFLPWALGVARHQVLMFWRTKRRDRHVFSETLIATLADDAVGRAEMATDRQRALDACVEGLPPRQRDLIRMFYGENKSADTIAASWDRTVHAVYKALKVMRKSLLECVERRLAAEGLAPEPSP
jgi:RNA polymerase sigma-70 factor (ECF subfamily)